VARQLDGAERRLAQAGDGGAAAGQVQVGEMPGRAPATPGRGDLVGGIREHRERDGTRYGGIA
jgi:hypothetical protein